MYVYIQYTCFIYSEDEDEVRPSGSFLRNGKRRQLQAKNMVLLISNCANLAMISVENVEASRAPVPLPGYICPDLPPLLRPDDVSLSH